MSIQDKVKEELAAEIPKQQLLPKPDHPKSLRDEFAMATLNGIMINTIFDSFDFKKMAQYAYRQADAMMEERKNALN